MPNIKSAKKRVLVIEKKAMRNKAIKTALKTQIKKYLAAIEAGDKEIRVFENAQQQQATHYRNCQPEFFPLFALCLSNSQSAQKKQQNRGNHQHHIFGLSPCVENQTGHQQHRVFQCSGNQKI